MDIIEAIDGALDDWLVSDDAMRWTPPEQRQQSPRVCEVSELAVSAAQLRSLGDVVHHVTGIVTDLMLLSMIAEGPVDVRALQAWRHGHR